MGGFSRDLITRRSTVTNTTTKTEESATEETMPPIGIAINTLGQAAQNIHEAAGALHPGDQGIMVSLAAQIGTVGQMFMHAVKQAQEAEQKANDAELEDDTMVLDKEVTATDA